MQFDAVPAKPFSWQHQQASKQFDKQHHQDVPNQTDSFITPAFDDQAMIEIPNLPLPTAV
jgi:hypothetical protein